MKGSMPAQDSLRGFWRLFVTQFQGAFSDNALKTLVIFMLVAMDVTLARKHLISGLVGALFSLPFILFSMAGGFLAGRFSKRTVSVGVKIFEILVMLLALVGFLWESMPVLLCCVFLMGMHSAFFGPSKYGLLPELLPEKKLSWGNGLLEFGTYTAIILGTVAAGLMAENFRGHHGRSGATLIALAAIGLVISLGITRVPAADPQRKFRANFLGDLFSQTRSWRGDRPLILAVLGNTYLSFIGALLLLNVFFFGIGVLKASEAQIGWLNASLAVGIGLGSVTAGYLSGNKIEYGLVPLGAAGISAACLSLAAPGLSLSTTLVRLALLGFAGGFFIVPICALLQHLPDKSQKGEVLAAANLLSFVGVFLASGVHFLLAEAAGLSPGRIFLFGSVLTLAGAVYVVVLLPDSLLRVVLWALTRTIYRIHVVGRDNIPAKGGALFVCNHVSFVDAMLLLASTDRQVRFMVFKDYYELPYFKPFARALGLIPISSEQRPREMIRSLRTAGDAIRAGGVVCIFAEGQITRIGHLLPFRRGFERIMKDVDAPIVPVALDGVWGSVFSFHKGRFLWKIPRRLPYPVTVNYGKPMPPSATPFEVRQAVQELLAAAWQNRKGRMNTLHRALVRTARRHPFRFAMADAQNSKVRFGAVLVRAVFLARRLRHVWADQKMVGILLPPSVPGALVNYAAILSGKVPVNLNYTLSDQALASCIGQCGINKVITAKAFLEKVRIRIPYESICLEDVVGTAAPRTDGDAEVPAARPPLPGISVRIVDPETMTPVPRGQPGLMLVQGPNVMQGYLGLPEKTLAVMVSNGIDGISSVPAAEVKWYVTGDIAAIDDDGFLQITDRLSRFSKIGGEMVPHGQIEEKLHEAAGATEQTFVVTGVKDERKGEQLVVFHKLGDEPLQSCLEKLARSDLPNLWKPRADHFFRVETFPCLGSGKLDLRRIREMAEREYARKWQPESQRS
jgi:acyl-[acyl-carrier-protein]-phospholipid O-acyltransferase/long-chain-fatty-acid--[acyl-carrier-protein] ligase